VDHGGGGQAPLFDPAAKAASCYRPGAQPIRQSDRDARRSHDTPYAQRGAVAERVDEPLSTLRARNRYDPLGGGGTVRDRPSIEFDDDADYRGDPGPREPALTD